MHGLMYEIKIHVILMMRRDYEGEIQFSLKRESLSSRLLYSIFKWVSLNYNR